MKISSAFPSKYLKAADLDGRQVKVAISHVDMEDIGGDVRPVLYFIGKDKGVVLNRTNSNTISAAYGDDTEEWPSKELVLFETEVDFQGKRTPAIRMKVQRKPVTSPPKRDEQNPPPIDDDIPF